MEQARKNATFKQETITKLLQLNLKSSQKSRVGHEAAALVTEIMRIFVQEGAARAAICAQNEDLAVVNVEHFEKILAQLMLDF